MSQVLPTPFLFRYSLPVRRIAKAPKRSAKKLLSLSDRYRLPQLVEAEGSKTFADVRVGWHEQGFGCSVRVTGRSSPLACDQANPAESDGLQLWIDTRNTQNIHRATRFCHHFCFLPAKKTRAAGTPFAAQLQIARAREETPLAGPKSLPVAVQAKADGYQLDAWLPADVLTGFDPDANPRLGFYYYVRDSELGEQFLTVGSEFPFASDPSLWSTLELTA